AGQVTLVDRAESAYANHFLAFVNFGGPDAIAAAIGARMQLNAAPVHNRYMLHLEAAYRDLLRTNARLARQWLGSADAAAARRVDQSEERIDAAERRAELAEAAVRDRDVRIAEMEQIMVSVWNSGSWRITRPLRPRKD